MKRLLLLPALAVALLSPAVLPAQDSVSKATATGDQPSALSAEERQSHQELTALRIAVQDAFNKMGASGKADDMAALLEYAHPDIIFTAMTGESVRGKQELMEYFKRSFVSADHSLIRMQGVFTADHLSIFLRPDVATNRGTSRGTFVFKDGSELAVDSRWTATMVKDQGRWKIAAFQFAPSIFDNPVTSAYRAWIYKGAIIAALVGLLLGALIGWWMRRPRAA
jgi:ketosteroid isomerase-like protein